MRMFERSHVGVALFTIVCLSVPAPRAQAQPEYRVINIAPDETLAFGETRRLKLNNDHEVVGTIVVGGDEHAFIWLPQPNYGLPQGLTDLHVASEMTQQTSAAHDINDYGYVAGEADGHAFVWKLEAPAIVKYDLTTFGSDPIITLPQIAWALSNSATPDVVGEGGGLWDCECPHEEETLTANLGFRVAMPAGNVEPLLPHQNLQILDCDQNSRGRAVEGIAAGSSWRGNVTACIVPSPCAAEEPGDAVSFTGDVELDDFGDGNSEARGVNVAGNIAGVGWITPAPCISKALFWMDPTAMHAVLDTAPTGHQGAAEAINTPDAGTPLRVVGTDTDADTAQLWESTDGGSSWTAYDVNDLVGACSGNWDIRRGDDVNGGGWIVGIGIRSNEPHPLLLEPITTCRWDLTGDGVVSTIDFLTLLTSWGPCPAGLPCQADFDCSESVSTADFLDLLSHWGPCGQAPVGPPQTVQDCINRFGTEDVLLLEHCICTVEPDECPEE